jgi:microcystin-dependent protein
VASPYVGEIRIFGGNFAPQGWAFCDGQILPISQNEVLFQLIGTTYGGDGQTTFELPDLRGRRPVHQGDGAGLSPYVLGQSGGVESVELTTPQLAEHSHLPQAVAESGTVNTPSSSTTWAQWSDNPYSASGPGTVPLGNGALGNAGSSLPHENRSGFLVLSYIISLFGVFPSQN